MQWKENRPLKNRQKLTPISIGRKNRHRRSWATSDEMLLLLDADETPNGSKGRFVGALEFPGMVQVIL